MRGLSLKERERYDLEGRPYCEQCGRLEGEGWVVVGVYASFFWEDDVPIGTPDPDTSYAFCSWECASLYASSVAAIL